MKFLPEHALQGEEYLTLGHWMAHVIKGEIESQTWLRHAYTMGEICLDGAGIIDPKKVFDDFRLVVAINQEHESATRQYLMAIKEMTRRIKPLTYVLVHPKLTRDSIAVRVSAK